MYVLLTSMDLSPKTNLMTATNNNHLNRRKVKASRQLRKSGSEFTRPVEFKAGDFFDLEASEESEEEAAKAEIKQPQTSFVVEPLVSFVDV